MENMPLYVKINMPFYFDDNAYKSFLCACNTYHEVRYFA